MILSRGTFFSNILPTSYFTRGLKLVAFSLSKFSDATIDARFQFFLWNTLNKIHTKTHGTFSRCPAQRLNQNILYHCQTFAAILSKVSINTLRIYNQDVLIQFWNAFCPHHKIWEESLICCEFRIECWSLLD